MREWHLDAALTLIRVLQPKAFKLNFYLALAGGVLNKGSSKNDLDLVAVNNSPGSKAHELQAMLENELGSITRSKLINGRVHLKWETHRVEVLIIERDSHG